MLLDLTHIECSLSEQDNSFLNPGEKKNECSSSFMILIQVLTAKKNKLSTVQVSELAILPLLLLFFFFFDVFSSFSI